MSYYYGKDRSEKERIVNEWWDLLEYQEQQEVLADAYPDEIIEYEDYMWEALDWKIRWEIYNGWKGEDYE